jgi:Co/Zn/Cd efflux system component
MLLEIVGGIMFGSIALVADGMHMSTHAGALLLAALAYSYARKHAVDDRLPSEPASSAISRASAAPLCSQ